MDSEHLLDVSRRLSAALTPADLDSTLSTITAAAVEVLPDVRYASITVAHADGRLETSAVTAELIRDLDAAQYELREGPCYGAAVEAPRFTSPDLQHDARFPRYAPVAARYGIRAQAGIRLFETKTSQGALNLYAEEAGAFADFEAMGALFAHQSATALAYARHVDDLQAALASRQVIGQAVGLVMERYGLDDARAFAFLTRMSSHENVKMRDLARRLVEAHQAAPGGG